MKVKKDLVGIGSAMLIWFVVLVVIQLNAIVDIETSILGFLSVPVFSIILLILGVIPEKKGSL